MRGRAHAKKPRTQTHAHSQQPRTQTNKINARARAFKTNANSIKQCQCAGARIPRNCERKQTMSMRGRAHAKTLRIQRNKINVKARAFNKAANSRKQSQCAGARIQQNRELKQRMSMCGRAHSKKTRTQANNINVKARTFKEIANSSKQD